MKADYFRASLISYRLTFIQYENSMKMRLTVAVLILTALRYNYRR